MCITSAPPSWSDWWLRSRDVNFMNEVSFTCYMWCVTTALTRHERVRGVWLGGLVFKFSHPRHYFSRLKKAFAETRPFSPCWVAWGAFNLSLWSLCGIQQTIHVSIRNTGETGPSPKSICGGCLGQQEWLPHSIKESPKSTIAVHKNTPAGEPAEVLASKIYSIYPKGMLTRCRSTVDSVQNWSRICSGKQNDQILQISRMNVPL